MKEKQTINELPKDWKQVKLGEACTIVMGQSPPSTSYNTDGIGLPFFQGKAEFTQLHPVAEKWCNTPNKIALANDILLSVRAPVGTTNIADQKCCIGRGLAAIRFENYKYAFYFLRSIQHELDSKGTGTTFRAISGETIRETLFPLPPKEVQQQIVSKIEELFSELDKGIEELKTAQQQLKVYRQAVLKWAFEGKLTNEDVEDGELPEDWRIELLGNVLEFVGSGVTPKGGQEVYQSSGVMFIRSQNVYPNKLVLEDVAFISDEIDDKMKRTRVKPHDVLLNITGASIGRCAFVPKQFVRANVNQHVCILRPVKTVLNPVYLSAYLNSSRAQSAIMGIQGGATRQGLNFQQIRNLTVPVCSTEEQQQIVQEIESRLSVCDRIEETITDSLKQAEALRQSILKKAFEGKL